MLSIKFRQRAAQIINNSQKHESNQIAAHLHQILHVSLLRFRIVLLCKTFDWGLKIVSKSDVAGKTIHLYSALKRRPQKNVPLLIINIKPG